MDHCSARSKRTGQPCQRPSTPGRSLCYYHGGKNLRGLAAPAWKDGRYSKALPASLLDAYERARQDPELIALRDELALMDARLTALLGGITRGDTREVWDRLRALWLAWELAQADGDAATMERTLRVIGGLIQEGAAATETWSEIYDLADLRRRLADTERKRLEALQATVTADRALALIGALATSVRKHVTDRDALAAITADIELVLRGTPEVARAAG